MKGQNHFSKCACIPSPLQLVFICLMPWKGYLTRTSSKPSWLPERKVMPWSLLTWKQLSCWDLAMLLCQLISCVCPPLPWCGYKGCIWEPTESTLWEHLYDCDDHWKPNISWVNQLDPQNQGKTKQNKQKQPETKQKTNFIQNDQEYIKSSSDLFGAVNSFQP